ncbi:MAG: GNAT family N-acetyltransferase [Bacteroidia bacterium]
MLSFRTPTQHEFLQIRNYIRQFELDDRGLKPEEFTAAFRDNKLVGFGRLRKHYDSTELCSLGVVTPYRRKGIGKAIVKELIKKSQNNIHLVCIIPEFFTPFGFKIVENFPESIKDKILYCTSELVVPETYVAMLLEK